MILINKNLATFFIIFILLTTSLLGYGAEQSFAVFNKTTWKKDLFSWKTSPVDLSFLNHKPAGKYGPVRTAGEMLVYGNGTEARFWGVNIQASALFQTTEKNIKIQARRLAELGINLVRMHHHDASWLHTNVFIKSNYFLNPAGMLKLDQWITALRNQGIYIWLDLHDGRKLHSDDGIDAFKETKGLIKPYNYLNISIQKRMLEFQQQYLSHTNQFTGLKYKDDPAIMGLLITNENDLTNIGGNAFLARRGVPFHTALFNKDRQKFSDKTGLSYSKTYNTWLPGESKIYLNDLEHRFNQKMLSNLDALGIKIPIATTSLWGGAAYSLPALTDGSIIDSHAYGHGNALIDNPRNKDIFLTQVSLAAVNGKPVAVSEWNLDKDVVPDRFYMPLYTAAISSLQGWDAPMLFGYSNVGINQSIHTGNWSSFNDPALMGMMPAAALLFRQKHVAIANQTYYLQLSRKSLFYKSYKGSTSSSIRTLLEQHRFTVGLPPIKELPWLKETLVPADAVLISNAMQDYIPSGQDFVESDTKELYRNWKQGYHSINTKSTQAASGWIGGNTIELTDITIFIDTSNALVAVQSMDNNPITTTGKILITISAQVTATANKVVPFWSEPVIGNIIIKAMPGKQLYPLKNNGEKGSAVKTDYSDGKYYIRLTAAMPSHWYILTE